MRYLLTVVFVLFAVTIILTIVILSVHSDSYFDVLRLISRKSKISIMSIEELLVFQEPTKNGYLIPLEGNRIKSTRVQARGVVSLWSPNKLTLQISDKLIAINLPKRVNLLCVPETMINANGQSVSTRDAYIDISNWTGAFIPMNSDTLERRINVGDAVGVVAILDGKDSWRVDTVIGFGCK